MATTWHISGEFLISCNCDVFCPCVLSLGRARPSQGYCYSWFGFHIAEGNAGTVRLDRLNVAVMLEVPGPMEQGNWKLGLYIDERASQPAVRALTKIFTGQAGGPPGWWSIMIADFLGSKRVPITFEAEEKGWRFTIPKIIEGVVEPISGAEDDSPVRITNSPYWMNPEVVVGMGKHSRIRDWGRNWNFTGKSAEYGRFDWKGP
jgi:hypothetical protein